MPQVIKLEQRSAAWRQWRAGGIGGSDAPTIMCENPFSSPYELWAERVGLRPPRRANRAMQRGIDREQEAVDALAQHLGEFLPSACLQHDDLPFMLCSLDGYAPPDIAAEVKAPDVKWPSPRTHTLAREGIVPLMYHAQCQHNLVVSGCKILYFASYYPEDRETPLAVVPVLPDEAYIARLIATESEFWRCVTDRQPPKERPRLRIVEDGKP